jgi:methionine aminopeptidase
LITIKSEKQIEGIRKSCHELAKLLDILEGGFIKEGMNTKEIDDFCHNYILNLGGKPAFLGYGGFPASACISVNDVVIHGIPSKTQIVKNEVVENNNLDINEKKLEDEEINIKENSKIEEKKLFNDVSGKYKYYNELKYFVTNNIIS